VSFLLLLDKYLAISRSSARNNRRSIYELCRSDLPTSARVVSSVFFRAPFISHQRLIRSACCRRDHDTIHIRAAGMTNAFRLRKDDRIMVSYAVPGTCAENVLVASITLSIDKRARLTPYSPSPSPRSFSSSLNVRSDICVFLGPLYSHYSIWWCII